MTFNFISMPFHAISSPRLDSPDAKQLLSYLSCLEEALAFGADRTVLVPQRARDSLKSWPAERSLLRRSACALWEAMQVQGPLHLRREREMLRVEKK